MSPAAAGLPSTRLIRRRRSSRGWLFAVALTLVVNIALIIGLAQASRLASGHAEAPQPVRRIQRAPTPPPKVEPPPPTRPQTTAQTQALPTVALPALDLPSAGPTSGLELPAFTPSPDFLTLPDTVPAFAALADETVVGTGTEISAIETLAFDEAPVLLAALDLRRYYPRQALLRRIEGESVLRLELDQQGVVQRITVMSSTPPSVFDAAAETLGRHLRFSPAKRAGKAVPAIFTQTIHWTIER